MFEPLSLKTVRWRPVEGEGLEHLTVRNTDASIHVESVLIGSEAGETFGIHYQIDCDADWHVRTFAVRSTSGNRLEMQSDGQGHWQLGDGTPQPQFDGCIDIDFTGTPFSNTLPIRRLDLAPSDGSIRLRVLYVPFATLRPLADNQIYTCLDRGRKYRYEAADRPFIADLQVDSDGFVIDYPGLFERVSRPEKTS